MKIISNLIKISWCVSFALLSFIQPVRAQTLLDGDVTEILQQKLDSCVSAFNLPGLSVGLRLPEDKYWNGVSGVNDIYTMEPMDTSFLFYQASITKMFAATVVFLMIDEGILSLDDEVGQYLDPIPHIPSNTKIRYLLNHRSGLYNFLGNNPESSSTWFNFPDSIWTPQLAISTYSSPPDFMQGVAFSYSNTNYLLLGLIVEQIEGKPFAEVLRSRILEPYDLNQTFLPHIDEINGPLVTAWTSWVSFAGPYISDASPILNDCSASMFFTAGSLVSKPGDVARFTHLLFSGQIISPASLQLMKTCTNVNLGNGANGYGYGAMRYNFNGKTYFGHAGDLNGFTQLTIHQEQEGITLSISINRNHAPRGAIAQAILSALSNALTVGINSVASDYPSVQVYPNPSSGNFIIDKSNWHTDSEEMQVSIFNTTGSEIYNKKFRGFNEINEVNLQGSPGGLYLLRMSSGNQVFTKKIIIQ